MTCVVLDVVCEECEQEMATWQCPQCYDTQLCDGCDYRIHTTLCLDHTRTHLIATGCEVGAMTVGCDGCESKFAAVEESVPPKAEPEILSIKIVTHC